MRKIPLLAALFTLALAADAAACSCVPPETVYRDAEVAYIGRLVERVDEGGTSQRVTYTFEVERAVKGSASGRITYRANTNEASCGIDLEVGDRVGIMEAPDARELYSCSVVSVSELERLERPLPAARRHGRPAFLVGGMFGRYRSASLDERGRVVRYGKPPLGAASVCPRNRRFVSAAGRFARVRRVGDLRTIRRLRMGAPTAIRCLDARARRFVAFHYRPAGGRLTLYDGPRQRKIEIRGADGEVALGERRALVRLAPYDRASVAVVDYATGSVRTVLQTDRLVFGLALDPGERHAFVAASGIGRGTTVSVAPLSGGDPRSRSLSEDVEEAKVQWRPGGRVLVAASGVLRTFDAQSLELVERVDGWPYELARRGSRAYSVTDDGELVTADGERIRRVALLPRARVHPLVALPPLPHAAGAACAWREMRPPL